MNDTAQGQAATGDQTAAGSTMTITSGVDMEAVQKQASDQAAKATPDAEDEVQAIATAISNVPATDTTPEEELLTALKGYRIAAKTRFAHLLTGMANSTAEALRFMAEAEIHLADHIAQQKSEAK